MDVIHEETIMFVALMGLVGWVLFLLFRRQQLTTQAKFQRIEAYNKLLEKFATAKEFAEFLDTDQGKKMLEDPMQNGTNPKKTALRFVQAGVLLAALGFGLLMMLSRVSNIVGSQVNPDINWINKEIDYFNWTWITFAMAGGCFVAGMLSYSLGKKWKLLTDQPSKKESIK
ncbi:MAG: hypothetical protein EPO24_06325 [Bacteroidetes bacterium]|nr:MAG: hypothetical protein EPO24_06325 [Bacteroidota bacterium]